MGLFGTTKYDRLERRLSQLETILSQLATGQEVDVSPAALAGLPAEARTEVQRLKREGKEIQAIKYVRDQTHLGLREAKDLVGEL